MCGYLDDNLQMEFWASYPFLEDDMEDDLYASCDYIRSSIASILFSGDRDIIRTLHIEVQGLINLLEEKNGRLAYSESVAIFPTVRIYKKIEN